MDLATVIYGESSKPTPEELTKLMEDIVVLPDLQNNSDDLLLTNIAYVIHKWYPNNIPPDANLYVNIHTIIGYIQGENVPSLTFEKKQDISSAIDSYLMQLKIGLPPDNLKNILYVAIMRSINDLMDYHKNMNDPFDSIKKRIEDLKKILPSPPKIQSQQADLPQAESSFWYIGLFIAVLCIVIYLFTRATYRGKRRR